MGKWHDHAKVLHPVLLVNAKDLAQPAHTSWHNHVTLYPLLCYMLKFKNLARSASAIWHDCAKLY